MYFEFTNIIEIKNSRSLCQIMSVEFFAVFRLKKIVAIVQFLFWSDKEKSKCGRIKIIFYGFQTDYLCQLPVADIPI